MSSWSSVRYVEHIPVIHVVCRNLYKGCCRRNSVTMVKHLPVSSHGCSVVEGQCKVVIGDQYVASHILSERYGWLDSCTYHTQSMHKVDYEVFIWNQDLQQFEAKQSMLVCKEILSSVYIHVWESFAKWKSSMCWSKYHCYVSYNTSAVVPNRTWILFFHVFWAQY